MIVKFHGTPDELEYTVRMLIDSLARKHERELSQFLVIM